MKQKFIAIFILVAFSGSLFADTGSTLYGIFFPGINTDYTVNGVSKNTATTAMETQLKDAYTLFNQYQEQVVIGHSQGGYRALGYANYLKEKGEADKLKAIISIGAPARGFTPLIKGKDDLSRRIDNKVKITINGIYSCFSVLGIGNVTSAIPWLLAGGTGSHALYRAIVPFFVNGFSFQDWNSPSSVKMISNVLGKIVSDEVMTDFNPNSTYLKERIAPSYIPAQGHWVKVKIGEIRIWSIVIPLYKSVWVLDKPAQTVYKMPAHVKTGFIVGKGSVKEMVLAGTDGGTRAAADAVFTGMPIIMGLSYMLNGMLAAAALGAALACPFNFWAWSAVAYYSGQAGNAIAALCLWGSFDHYFNKDILLTDSSDGFIPYAAQKWDPKTELGCQTISPHESYVVYDVNHLTELEDDRIWGPGGDKYNPKENGKVHEWTYETTKKWFGSNYLMMMNH